MFTELDIMMIGIWITGTISSICFTVFNRNKLTKDQIFDRILIAFIWPIALGICIILAYFYLPTWLIYITKVIVSFKR